MWKGLPIWRSLPPRGAWIEIAFSAIGKFSSVHGRSPHGERGLKFQNIGANIVNNIKGRSPHGERGLK